MICNLFIVIRFKGIKIITLQAWSSRGRNRVIGETTILLEL